MFGRVYVATLFQRSPHKANRFLVILVGGTNESVVGYVASFCECLLVRKYGLARSLSHSPTAHLECLGSSVAEGFRVGIRFGSRSLNLLSQRNGQWKYRRGLLVYSNLHPMLIRARQKYRPVSQELLPPLEDVPKDHGIHMADMWVFGASQQFPYTRWTCTH
jgi:hypothetical protein